MATSLDYYKTDIGKNVKFKTYNINHNVTITGKIVAVCDSVLAGMLCDINNYNSRVAQSDFYKNPVNILPDIKNMNFIILELDDGTRFAYAIQWIDATTYQIISESGNVDIRLYGVTVTDVQSVLQQVAILGIAAKVVTA